MRLVGARLAGMLSRGALPSFNASRAMTPFAQMSTRVSQQTGMSKLAVPSDALALRKATQAALSNDFSLMMRGLSTRVVVDAAEPTLSDRHTDVKDRQTSQTRRNFTYFMVGGLRFMYASIIRFAVVRFIATMTMSAKVLALASIEVELESIESGKCSLITFRGKPLFVRHRTGEEVQHASESDADASVLGSLKDPQTDAERCPKPEWVVCMGVCTHLGCVPTALAGDYNGWFCPCHGSHYDTCGRIRKGPAPLNLEIPEYSFVSEDILKVG